MFGKRSGRQTSCYQFKVSWIRHHLKTSWPGSVTGDGTLDAVVLLCPDIVLTGSSIFWVRDWYRLTRLLPVDEVWSVSRGRRSYEIDLISLRPGYPLPIHSTLQSDPPVCTRDYPPSLVSSCPFSTTDKGTGETETSHSKTVHNTSDRCFSNDRSCLREVSRGLGFHILLSHCDYSVRQRVESRERQGRGSLRKKAPTGGSLHTPKILLQLWGTWSFRNNGCGGWGTPSLGRNPVDTDVVGGSIYRQECGRRGRSTFSAFSTLSRTQG